MDQVLTKIPLPKVITVKEFSEKISQPVAEVIKVLLKNGFLASINETLDFETAALIASEFQLEVTEEILDEKKVDIITPEQLTDILTQEEAGADLTERPPIITILGHVDHGKTTLLDTIRHAGVAQTEAGGITQHITAYQTKTQERVITFVDTPGHEAFSKMRRRGSQIADIAVLIVAADDGVKPQTKEVVANILSAKVPVIVAINKIDKPDANPERVKGQLTELGLLLEKRGGDVPCVEISAKQNIGINELLETIILLADVLKIKADPKRHALGLILESHLDQRKGAVATAIIKTGTLNEGDSVIAGEAAGTIKQILDYKNKRLIRALPGDPVTIIGMERVCKAGAVLQVAESKLDARKKTKQSRLSIAKELANKKANVKKINGPLKEENTQKLNIILKTDTEGSLEALRQVLEALPQTEVQLNILVGRVGNVTETDVQLAGTSQSIIYGFKTVVPEFVKQAGNKNKIEIKNFEVIYKMLDDVKEAMENLLPPEIIRTDLGKLEVLKVFRTEKSKMIVGGKIISGKAIKGAFLEIERNEEIIGKGKVEQLKRNQDAVEEVQEGQECGITYAPDGNFVKIAEKDKFKFYIEEAKKRKLV
jgi:translation initiation factor IF-2